MPSDMQSGPSDPKPLDPIDELEWTALKMGIQPKWMGVPAEDLIRNVSWDLRQHIAYRIQKEGDTIARCVRDLLAGTDDPLVVSARLEEIEKSIRKAKKIQKEFVRIFKPTGSVINLNVSVSAQLAPWEAQPAEL